MKHFIYILIACTAFVFAACSNGEEDSIIKGEDRRFAALSLEEVLSLIPDSVHTLSDAEVLRAIKSFSDQQSSQTRASVSKEMKIIKNYKVACDKASTTRTAVEQDSVEFSFVDLGIDKVSGLAVVCRDSRYPEVLAYVPTSNIQTYQSCIPMQMMVSRSQDVAMHYINKYNAIKVNDGTREKTMRKVCKMLNITEDEFDFAKYRSRIFTTNNTDAETRSTKQEPTGTLLSSVGPLCGTTRLIQGWPCNQFIETTTLEKYNSMQHNGHFPAGCVNVALATMCSYLQPTIYCSYLGRNINWNYVANTHFNPFSIYSSEYESTTPQAIEVGYLLKTISEKTKTTFDENGGSTNTANASSFMKSIGINMSSSTSTLNYSNVRTSLSNLALVYCTGTVTDNTKSTGSKGGHAWVIDGLQIRKPLARYELQNYNCFANCKFGWIEDDYNYGCDGWYLFDSKGVINFEFDTDNISTNLSCVPNVRKN